MLENVEKTNQQMPKGYIFKDNELHLEIEGKSSVKVSDKIEVLAEARDTESNNWGKVVRFMDHDNNTKTLLINNTKFITSGNELEEILCYNGLYISKPKELKKYLNDYKTKNRALCVDKIGWCNESFVFPDGSIIGKNNENMLGNGNGKIRSTKNGTAKKSFTWRILYLSSGEKNLPSYLRKDKSLISIPPPAFSNFCSSNVLNSFCMSSNKTSHKSFIL